MVRLAWSSAGVSVGVAVLVAGCSPKPAAGGDIPPDPCPSLGQQACRQRDDCIVIHYRGPSDEEPLGPFAECFTEPRPGQCQADYECPSGRCRWDNKICSKQMCWGECES